MSFKGLTHVSLLTLTGRVLVPFLIGQYQAARMDAIKGQADLIYRHGTFSLAVTLDVPEPTPQSNGDVLVVDLGMVNLATDSTGESFSGQVIEAARKRYQRLRQALHRRPIAHGRPSQHVENVFCLRALCQSEPQESGPFLLC